MDQELESKLSKKYMKMTGEKVKNLQEKYIVGVPKGQHSLHTQDKNQQVIR